MAEIRNTRLRRRRRRCHRRCRRNCTFYHRFTTVSRVLFFSLACVLLVTAVTVTVTASKTVMPESGSENIISFEGNLKEEHVEVGEVGVVEDNDDDIDIDLLEVEIVKEAIEAGRGHRDEIGVRDQWESSEHLNEGSKFDSRKPISKDVKRLLQLYRLECKNCDHREALRKVNKFVRETKRITKLEEQRRNKNDRWTHRFFVTSIVIGLSFAYVYRTKISSIIDKISSELGSEGGGGDNDLSGFTEAQRLEIMRLRRQHTANAAIKRQQQETAAAIAPTWFENEKKEIWTPKQEKQFLKALKEYSGIPKKERYKLISDKVDNKSRIECLTHHRMQELIKKEQQEQQ